MTGVLPKSTPTTKDVQPAPDVIDVTFKGLITTLSVPSQRIVRRDGAFFAQGHFQQSYPRHGGGKMPANDIQHGKRVYQSICFAVRSCLTTYQTLSGHHYRMFAGLLTIGPCVRQIQSEPRGGAPVEAVPSGGKDKTNVIQHRCQFAPRLDYVCECEITLSLHALHMARHLNRFQRQLLTASLCVLLLPPTTIKCHHHVTELHRLHSLFTSNFADVQLPISKW